MGYKKDTIKGFVYGFSGKTLIRGIGVVRISLLARILNPLQFGLFGIASLILALLETLTETGINVVLIQGKKNLEDYVSSAWVLSIIRGFLISAVILCAKPLIINFFNEPNSAQILTLIAFVPVIKGFINPSIIRYRKDLEFRKEYQLRVALFLIESAVSVSSSIVLLSAIGIVYGLIAGAIVEVVFSILFINPKPKLAVNWDKSKEIIKWGKWVNLTSITSYLSNEGDDFFVGRLLQTSSLGLYQGIYKIAILPLTEIAQVSTRVTLPVYAKIAGDKNRLKKAFNKIVLVISLLSISLGVLIYVFSFQIVMVLLGEKWLAGVPVLRILAVYGVLKAFINLSKSLLYSVKKQKMVALFSTTEMIILLVSIIPLISYYGLIGAAYASLLSASVVLPFIAIYIYMFRLK